MRRLVTAAIAASLLAGLVVACTPATPAEPLAISTVKIKVGAGHGSGVYLGKNIVLTAAHVVGTETQVAVHGQNKRQTAGRVLWVAKEFDQALLYIDAEIGVAASELSCAPTQIGQHVVAIGNPLNIEFARSHGTVATVPFEMLPIRNVVAMDVTTVMGMSGGPVFDKAGRVVGITVAVQLAQMGFSASLTRFGLMVPSTVVCTLLGR